MRAFLSVSLLAFVVTACAGASAPLASTARLLPARTLDAERELRVFGGKLYAALAAGAVGPVMFDDMALRALLLPAAASRVAAQRLAESASTSLAADERALLRSAHYASLCVQQGRAEPRAGILGLRAPGFVFERALLVGRDAGGGAVASWVEGRFLYTDLGFGALSITRVEPPRRDHADLELAECELRVESADHKL